MSSWNRHFRACIVVSAGLVLAASGARAYEYPSVERGIKPERAFHVGDIDQIRLFNGGLLVTIPIGQRFQVGPALSYQLTLSYNSQIWDYVGSLPPGSSVEYVQAWPVRGSNAGFGWRLSLGEYETISGVGRCADCYIAPDGGRHATYPTLHPNLPDDGPTRYTMDGTYLRVRPISGGHELDFPNGETHRFDGSGRLIQMRDPFGNSVSVIYTANAWTISDSHGRSHTVNMVPAAHYGQKVGSVVLGSFGGAQATYQFAYSEIANAVPRSCLDTDPETPSHMTLPLLTAVTQPAAVGSYSMPASSYYLESIAPSTCERLEGFPPQEGVLLGVTLPTLGRVEWAYGAYSFPVPVPEEAPRPSYLQRTAGVITRTLRDAGGAPIGSWVYSPCLTGPFGCLAGGQDATESVTTMTSPLGDKTEHYFRVGDDIDVLYGLPFSSLEAAPGRPDLFRSTKAYDCNTAGSSCELRRTTYLKYGVDDNPTTGLEVNPRVVATQTSFHDDGRWAALDYSGWDGLGHHRTEQTSGNFDAGNSRTRFTDYNPGSGPLGTRPVSQPWILDTFELASESEGGSTSTRTFDVDPATGWVTKTRIHRLSTGSTSSTDVVIETLHDGLGNLASERHYGGDAQAGVDPLGTGPLDSLVLPQPPDYRIDHATFYGTRATSTYVNAAGSPLPFKHLDCGDDPTTPGFDPGIDRSTGLPSKCRDTSGIATSYSHDPLGRIVAIQPQSGQDGRTEYTYTPATSASSLARVDIRRRPNAGGTALAESAMRFDALGRVAQEIQKMRDGSFSTRETTYSAMGWKDSISELGATTKKTVFGGYDPFGRPGQIVAPDGHTITFSYEGARTVVRALEVGTTFVGTNPLGLPSSVDEDDAWTTEIHDRQGRLHQLREPANPGGTNTTTTYFYDVGNRVQQVRQQTAAGTQNRFFTYDQRGFLLTESHPEKGASGNGTVTYSRHDARGHAGRKVDGPSTLDFTYDRAERLLTVRDTVPRDLKVFTYDSPGANAAGKVVTATRYNYVTIGATPFTFRATETHAYLGRGGRLSSRGTQAYIGASPIEGFSVGWAYDQLGNVSRIDYPSCIAGSCAGVGAAREVTNGYTHGWLSSIAGTAGTSAFTYASSIGYHPNGAPASIAHGNTVSLQVGLDRDFMDRPASFSTLGASVEWVSGPYAYDGAGNVTQVGASKYRYDLVSRLADAKMLVESASPGLPFADGFESGDTRCWDPGACLSGGNVRTQAFTYDPFGNLTAIAGSPGRDIPVSPQTNRLASSGSAYDAAGNLTSWNGAVSYKYGPFNEMWEMTNGGEHWLYLYTATDERLFSLRVGESRHNRWNLRGLGNETLREYNHIGETWTVKRDYVYRGASLLAAHTDQAAPDHLHYFHLDHLGTPRLITNTNAAAVAYHMYAPFGEELSPFNQNVERSKFTGHERDLNSPLASADDLDYMHARHYNSQIARFLSTDPADSSDKSAPQTWNRYAYVINNPLRYVDPTGKYLVGGNVEMAADKGWMDCQGFFGCAQHWVMRVLTAPDPTMGLANPIGIATAAPKVIMAARAATIAAKTAPLADDAVRAGAGVGFRSFTAFKRTMGPAGDGFHWHHIVEQTPGNVVRFGPDAVHNTRNLVRTSAETHRQISAYYSRIQPFTNGQTVRQWLSTQPLEVQREFGLQVMRDFGAFP